jgi:hypothetical protein
MGLFLTFLEIWADRQLRSFASAHEAPSLSCGCGKAASRKLGEAASRRALHVDSR